MSDIKTDSQEAMAIESRKTSLTNFIGQHTVNEHALSDCINAFSFESYPVNGMDRVVVRNAEGEILLKDEDILDHLKRTRPSYLYSDDVKERIDSVANDINAEYQREKDDLQAQVNAAASAGDFKLFKKLRKQQGATYR